MFVKVYLKQVCPFFFQSFFAERFFELFDQDSSGTIELSELMDGLRMLTKGTPAQKLQFLFDVYDVDGNNPLRYRLLQKFSLRVSYSKT